MTDKVASPEPDGVTDIDVEPLDAAVADPLMYDVEVRDHVFIAEIEWDASTDSNTDNDDDGVKLANAV